MQDQQYPRYQNQQDPGYQEQQPYYQDPQAELPLDPTLEKVRRKMVRLLAVSIGVMVIGLMAVLIAVVYKINKAPDTIPATDLRSDIPGQELQVEIEVPKMVESQLQLPEGARLLSHSLSGDRLSLETLLPDGVTEILVYDFKEARIIGKVQMGNVE